jgi:hypothetical protein
MREYLYDVRDFRSVGVCPVHNRLTPNIECGTKKKLEQQIKPSDTTQNSYNAPNKQSIYIINNAHDSTDEIIKISFITRFSLFHQILSLIFLSVFILLTTLFISTIYFFGFTFSYAKIIKFLLDQHRIFPAQSQSIAIASLCTISLISLL